MALDGFTINTSTADAPEQSTPSPSSTVLQGFSIGSSPSPSSTVLQGFSIGPKTPTPAAPSPSKAMTGTDIGPSTDSMIASTKPADTSNLFSNFLSQPNVLAPKASTSVDSSTAQTALPNVDGAPSASKNDYESLLKQDTKISETPEGTVQNLNNESAYLDTEGTSLSSLNDEINADKSKVDTTSQKSIDAFNQKVSEYNARTAAYITRANTYNEGVKTSNANTAVYAKPNGLQSKLLDAGLPKSVAMNPVTDYVGGVITDTLNKVTAFVNSLDSSNTPAQRVGTGVDAALGLGNLLFTPISLLFMSADKIPGINIGSKAVENYGSMTSDALSQSVQEIVNSVPDSILSKATKDALAKPLGDAAGFAEQIFLGGKVAETVGPMIKAKIDEAKVLVTKDIITKTFPGKQAYFNTDQIKDIWQTGTLLTDSEKTDVLKTIGGDSAKIRDAIKNGVSINVSPRVLVTLEDKPYWSSIKSFFGAKGDKPVVLSDTGGLSSDSVRGLLPSKSEPAISVPRETEVHPVLKDDVKNAIDTHGEDLTRQALQDRVGFDSATTEKIMTDASRPKTPEEIKAVNDREIAKATIEPERAPSMLQITDTKTGESTMQAIKPDDFNKFKDLIDTGNKNAAMALQTATGKSYHLTATDPGRMAEAGVKALPGYADHGAIEKTANGDKPDVSSLMNRAHELESKSKTAFDKYWRDNPGIGHDQGNSTESGFLTSDEVNELQDVHAKIATIKNKERGIHSMADLKDIVNLKRELTKGGIKFDKDASKASLTKLYLNNQGGFINPSAFVEDIVKAADAKIKNFIDNTMEPIAVSENLSDDLAKLEGAAQADLEIANKLVEHLDISKKDDEALYTHAENPDAKLTPKQQVIEQTVDAPLKAINQKLYERIKDIGIDLPISDTYISRFPKEKPSVLQKIFKPVKGKKTSAAQGGILSKSAPSLKKRTMKILTDEAGNRTVASIKDGTVTAFKNKQPESLGSLKVVKNDALMKKEIKPLKDRLTKLQDEQRILTSTKGRATASPERIKNIQGEIVELNNNIADIENKYNPDNLNDKVFVGDNGTKYKIGEATTAEIEEHTNLEYYHSALASRVTQYVKLRQIDRALQFLESWKASDDFSKIAVKSDEIPPEGWKQTSQVNFRNYYFEPRVAEILDDMQDKIKGGQYNDAFQGLNRVLADAIFFNGLAHPINVIVTWAYNRGASSLVLPSAYASGLKSFGRALKAMQTKNDDYIQLLKNGAHLMSSDVTNKKLAENIMKKVGAELDSNPDLRTKIINALGIVGDNANPIVFKKNIIYKISHNLAWLSNDLFTMQSIFEAMDRHNMTMPDAIKEVSKFIPDYRQQSRLLDKPLTAIAGDKGGATARFIAKNIMYNRLVSMFGSYHVGLLQSLTNSVKDSINAGEGFSKEANATRARGIDKIAMLAILGLVAYPAIDELVKKITGNPNTYITRSGIVKYPYLAYKYLTGQTNTTTALSGIITPAVGTQSMLELFFNRDLFTGNNIYGIGGEGLGGFLAKKIAPIAEVSKLGMDTMSPGDFALTFLGIHTPKNAQVALDLNAMIYTQKPIVDKQMKALIAGGDTVGAQTVGHDFNTQLAGIIKKADIAAGNSGSDARVQFFLNQYGVKMPGQVAMNNYNAKQGQNIVDKTLPNGKPVIVKNTPISSDSVIGTIVTYAKALGTDPISAFKDIFSGQTIKSVTNGTIIVNRMSLAQSTAIRDDMTSAQGISGKGMILDHIVELEGGGTNDASNLQMITAQEDGPSVNQPIEDFIGRQIKAGNMTAAQSREISIRFKAGQGQSLSPELMNEYKTKYGGKPLNAAQVYDFKNWLDK